MSTYAIILAGGSGSRMHSQIPKQYMILNEKPVLFYSLDAFEQSKVDKIILVAGEHDREMCQTDIVDRFGFHKVTTIVSGGKERFNSVQKGLATIMDNEGIVLIHDGARPCITTDIINKCIEDAKTYSACVTAVPVKDTIKIADQEGYAITTPDRNTLWQIQTPQAFSIPIIKGAYVKMNQDSQRGNITDDAMVVEKYSECRVKMSMGGYTNIKITTPEDISIASVLLAKAKKA